MKKTMQDSVSKKAPSTKRCSRCAVYQSIDCFHKNAKNKDGHNYWCKDCMREYKRPKEDPKAKWEYHIKKTYDLDPKAYHALLMDQAECCAICFEHESVFSRALYVDHNHETGEIRGLLCSKCNSGIGYFGDSPMNLRSAADYLESRGSYG